MRERPTIVLLHGGPGFDHTRFKPNYGPMAAFAQVVYLDHRSHGRSDRTGSDRWTLDCWADDVAAFCDALEIAKPVVIGTSFGGFVAMNYAIRHPDHPAKIILCTTAARARLDRAYDVFERLGGKRAREVAEAFWTRPNPETVREYRKVCMPLYTRTPGDRDAFARGVFSQDVLFHWSEGEENSFDLRAGLAKIQCPTLVLGGEDDPITPIADSEDIVAALPKDLVRFERFPNAGHGIVADAPERFFAVIKDFVGA
jgi:pimeloyl-ACP methyl ester carboxylesterase